MVEVVKSSEVVYVPEVEIAKLRLLECALFTMKEKLRYLFSEEERIKGEESRLSKLIMGKQIEKEARERSLRERGLIAQR